jgi:hypothetical protein
MDPYHILGISQNATQKEIKKAYRREAMKWHPDRSNNSDEAKERFHLAAEAYKILSRNKSTNNNTSDSSSSQQYKSSYSDQSHENDSEEEANTGDEFADSVFWDVMLDYAIKLAQNGLNENTISISLTQKGCPQKLASIIAGKAFNIHAHYDLHSGRKHKPRTDDSSFKDERLEAELMRAFIGSRSFFWSPRHTLEYYLGIFNDFGRASKFNPFTWVIANRRLTRILSFALMLYVVILIAIEFLPGPNEYKILPDLIMLQVPLGLVGLMILWSIYRKLWTFTIVLGLSYGFGLAIFNTYMPQVLYDDRANLLLISAICFSPFIFTALFGNYIYYRKAVSMIKTANRLFDDQIDKLVWVQNRSGTSSTAVILWLIIGLAPAIYLIPEDSNLFKLLRINLPTFESVKNDDTEKKIRLQLEEANQFFVLAETLFNHSPPDYMKAEMAYSTAADNGSILAAYKLGYMYYSGKGVEQNDVLAIENFERAIRAPLAFQPHSLQLTTEYLAESYNSLGIMYQYGYGIRKDSRKAYKMFQLGSEFGSKSARQNLKTAYQSTSNSKRMKLLYPTY